MKNFTIPKLGAGLYTDVIDKLAQSSLDKSNLNKLSPSRSLISAMLGSFFVSLGIMLIYTIGGIMAHHDIGTYKILMGVSFGVALSLVIMAGGDLYTGNAMITAVGFLKKKINKKEGLLIIFTSWIGNLIGGLIGAGLYISAGLATGSNDYIGEFIIKNAITKTTLPWNELFFRGLLCNVLVCLAIWMAYKLKEETAKILMIFWCLFAFITSGFEHSVANMSFIGMGYFLDPSSVTLSGFFHNLLWVSIGNYVGGVLFLGIPYFFISTFNVSKKESN